MVQLTNWTEWILDWTCGWLMVEAKITGEVETGIATAALIPGTGGIGGREGSIAGNTFDDIDLLKESGCKGASVVMGG